MAQYHKHDIAKFQLITAVEIFLSGKDRSSVIRLAGAASGILDTLVNKAGKEPFVDYARRVHHKHVGYMPKRKSYSHHIDKQLGVVDHKHLSKNDSETVDLDLDKMAVDALIRATSDYIALNGQDEPFIKMFLQWTWVNMDGEVLMEKFKSDPERIKPL